MHKGNGALRKAIKAIPKQHWNKVSNGEEFTLDLPKGSATSVCLFENERINIARTHVSKGSIFPSHVHEDIREHIIVELGHIELLLCESGTKINMTESDCYIVDCNTLHSARILEDTVLIAISMPPDPDFPHPAC